MEFDPNAAWGSPGAPDPAHEFRVLSVKFGEDLNDVGGDLLQAYKGRLQGEALWSAVAKAEQKLEEFASCVRSLGKYRDYGESFAKQYDEDVQLLRERVVAIRINPEKYGTIGGPHGNR